MKPLTYNQTLKLFNVIDPEEHIPVLIGPPGLGKSACIKDFCNKKGIPPSRMAFLSVALNDTGDIVGFPYKTDDGNVTMKFATPFWWLGQYNEDGTKRAESYINKPFDDGLEYCLVIDEANRDADPQKQAAMINLFLERNIQGRYLPKRTYVILSINQGENYLVEDFDPAVKNRIMPIYFQPKYEEWVEYFKKSNNYHYLVVKFMEEYGGSGLHFIPLESRFEDQQFSSPRSFSKLGKFLVNFEIKDDLDLAKIFYLNLDDELIVLQMGIYGIIGEKAGKEFIAMLQEISNKRKNDALSQDSIPKDLKDIITFINNDVTYQRKKMTGMSPLSIENFMKSFINYMNSGFFIKWDRKNKTAADSIIHNARNTIPGENIIEFIHSMNNIENNSGFDMYKEQILKSISDEDSNISSIEKIVNGI